MVGLIGKIKLQWQWVETVTNTDRSLILILTSTTLLWWLREKPFNKALALFPLQVGNLETTVSSKKSEDSPLVIGTTIPTELVTLGGGGAEEEDLDPRDESKSDVAVVGLISVALKLVKVSFLFLAFFPKPTQLPLLLLLLRYLAIG